MLVKILTEPQNALVKQYQQLFSMDECELKFTRKPCFCGPRLPWRNRQVPVGLRSVVDKCLIKASYEQPGSSIKSVIVTEDVVRKNTLPVYVKEDVEADIANKTSS
ncbi:hypothetical protein DPMN_048555 [Dreissena polymorpha]|uniref:Uncharacterized protein n=1 Tax=Dreissena polymorpha TaxID=45954 RepID=A0A9D4D9T6_DREPO|nr:hypothetical protein DPMN_048555 [Dreissena polymorpha]